jgi:hypothetical protein
LALVFPLLDQQASHAILFFLSGSLGMFLLSPGLLKFHVSPSLLVLLPRLRDILRAPSLSSFNFSLVSPLFFAS